MSSKPEREVPPHAPMPEDRGAAEKASGDAATSPEGAASALPVPDPATLQRSDPPTIRDVALKAGVSLGTASNVLNGKDVVSAAKRALVLDAAAAIGYRPNRLARGLRGQRTQLIGLCVTMISSAYHSSLVESLDEVAFTSDRHLIQMLTHGDPERELAQIETLLEHQVDGIILMPSAQPERALDRLAASGVPTVIIDRAHEHEGKFDLVLLEHAAAMREGVRHLLDLGHRRLLFLVRHPSLQTTRERIDALTEMMAQQGGAAEADVLALTHEAERLAPALAERLNRPQVPTAIIASNSINTMWTLRALKRFGLKVPQDLSLLAFDEPAWGELVDPPLSLIRQPVDDIASTAWSLLQRRIAEPRGARETVMLQNALVLRGSTGPVRQA